MDWSAVVISPRDERGRAPILRREVVLDAGTVAHAVLHVTSLGIHEATIDDVPVSPDVLEPGWTSYEWRLRYRSHDVTALVRPRFTLAARLGDGWYRGRLGWSGGRAHYGDRLGLLAQLEVTFADGHRQVVGTDETWSAVPSTTVRADLYDGQVVDARPVPAVEGLVDVLPFDLSVLTPAAAPPVRRQEARAPVAVWTSPAGRTLVDCGQNLVGWLRLRVRGPEGTEVVIRHAEVLEDGELGVRPLRTARATDRFVLSGGDDVFEPTATFHGFRYAEISGWPGGLDLGTATGAVEAVVVHTEMRRIGHFACSDERLEQLHRNVVWGWRGNAVAVPTDCPQRDERLGWTGDLAVFAPTAAFLYDVGPFLGDWLRDLALEQAARDGRVPMVVPDVLKFETSPLSNLFDATAIWGDAAVWVPWALWQAYGDRGVLDAQYDSMAAHLRRCLRTVSDTGLWDGAAQLGDWLDPDAPPDQPWAAKAHPAVVATACLYRTASMVAEAAALTGHDADATAFAAVAERTRAAFVEGYVADDGRIRSDAATAYALAIAFGLLDELDDVRGAAGDRLAELVAEAGFHVSTGFAGTPFVTDALTRTGHVDVAYRLLLEDTCPSWLYAVGMGATTVWERWDSMLPDGSINPGEMTSFNHYALGAVVDWVHRTVGGIAPLDPGYRRVLVAPRPGGGITWASTSLDTPHGRVSVDWRLGDDGLEIDVDAPDSVTVVVDRP